MSISEGGKGGKTSQIKVIGSASAAVAVLLLISSSIYTIWRRKILKKGMKKFFLAI